MLTLIQSLSARRAWIEIGLMSVVRFATSVALRKESVDRNPYLLWQFGRALSLSARRAWIEIVRFTASLILPLVALRKESVDRNFDR